MLTWHAASPQLTCALPAGGPQLLQSPLSQQRQRGLAATLDLLSLPLAAVQPVAELIGHTQTGLGDVLGALAMQCWARQATAWRTRVHASCPTRRSALQQILSQLVPSLWLPPPAWLAGLAPADAVCHATISCLCLMVQVVLPTMISALVWPRPPAGESAAEDGMACMPGLRAAAKKAGEGADLWLRRATGATSGAWVRCLVFWYLLSNVWLLCKVSEGV